MMAMAESVQRKNFNIFHNELLDFLLLDGKPGMGNRAALHFGVDRSTISVIMNSDIFQAKLRDRQDAKHEAVVMTIKDKMVAAADVGLDKITAQLQVSTNLKDTAVATDKLLGRLGYGQKSGPVINPVQNNYFITPEDLELARRAIPKEHVHGQSVLPAPAASEEGPALLEMGEGKSLTASLLETGENNGSEEGRSEV